MLSLEKSYIINSLLVGLGFFGVELTLILMSKNLPGAQSLIEIAILHIGTAGLIGYFVATKNPKKITTFLLAIVFAIVFHASYNLLLLQREAIQNYSIFAILGLLILLNIANFFRISNKLE
jgi:CHASE2 domain-containing sensor protein